MATFTAVFDACVLFPFSVRDLLVELGTTNMFRARWTHDIHEEWMSSVSERYGIEREKLERIRDLMDESAEHCIVTGYESLIDGLELPDANDRHVLAAAIRTKADVIVTFNLADFPPEALGKYDIEAQHPDEFIPHLFDLDSGEVIASVRRIRGRLQNPPFTPGSLLNRYKEVGLPETASKLRAFEEML